MTDTQNREREEGELERRFRELNTGLDSNLTEDDVDSILFFIRSIESAAYERGKKEAEERYLKNSKNEIAFIANLRVRCPECGEYCGTDMTYEDAYKANALWGRCFQCATGGMNLSSGRL